ncbi:MAG: hypothetical protein LKG27_01245 [Clostridiaceae bacterium]|nr:hypothetical protein [Clostridiaceae bacterium]
MGLSGSQARLLSITARLTDNELHSQLITQAKIRLASESAAASNEYIDSLSQTKLQIASYDSNGTATYSSLTPDYLLTFSELKNQYGMVDTSGNLLVSSSIADVYQKSNTLNEFLENNGISKIENTKYTESMTQIYGTNYTNYPADKSIYTEITNNTTDKITTLAGATDNATNYNNAASALDASLSGYAEMTGIMGNYRDTILNYPTYVEVPTKPADYNIWDDAVALLSPQCWDSTGIDQLLDGTATASNDNVWHMEHVLAQYLWSPNSLDTNYDLGGTLSATGKDASGNSASYTIQNTSGIWALSSGGGNGDDPKNVRDTLALSENAELKTKLINLYLKLALNIVANNTNSGLTSGNIKTAGGTTLDQSNVKSYATVESSSDLGTEYKDTIKELLLAVAKNDPTIKKKQADHDALVNQYNENLAKRDAFVSAVKAWVTSVGDAGKKVLSQFPLPDKQVPNPEDSKYQWYTNLWYRMGAGDDKKTAYKTLDDKFLDNSSWIKYALEQGIVTIEQAKTVDGGSAKYPDLKTTDWVSTIYTSCSDMSETEDTLAQTKAEAKYQKATTEIEAKDKQYDSKLKNLDTIHSALQTEYESVKTVISKNIERSFKTLTS